MSVDHSVAVDYRRKIPSVDPEMGRAAEDIIERPDSYFSESRALREREAVAYLDRVRAGSGSFVWFLRR